MRRVGYALALEHHRDGAAAGAVGIVAADEIERLNPLEEPGPRRNRVQLVYEPVGHRSAIFQKLDLDGARRWYGVEYRYGKNDRLLLSRVKPFLFVFLRRREAPQYFGCGMRRCRRPALLSVNGLPVAPGQSIPIARVMS